MNTIKSVYYGWGVLIAAGGGAYVLAKRSINADRANKAAAEREAAAQQAKLRKDEFAIRAQRAQRDRDNQVHKESDGGANPSSEATNDPAPTRHAPLTEGQKAFEKSKYEASEVWRSPKGDRLG